MNKSIQKVIETIQAHLDDGELVWHKPFITAYQANAASKNEYQGINQLITALVAMKESYTSPFWATFKQIDDLGGKLKDAKGKGVPVLFYKDLSDDDEKRRFVCKHSFVFNLDLVEGIDIESINPEHDGFTLSHEASQLADDYIQRENIHLSHGAPAYVPSIDTVKMLKASAFTSREEFYSAFFHELAHSTGHKSRLSRFEIDAETTKEEYSKEELIAEATAAMLCHDCGVDSKASIKNSAAYIAGWSKFIKDNGSAFVSAVNHAYKARNFIHA